MESLQQKVNNTLKTNDTTSKTDEVIYKQEVYDIMKCGFEVYNHLGYGFLEAVYQEAMEIELKRHNIDFESQKTLRIYYDGQELTKKYIADIICFDKILIELKTSNKLAPADIAQVQNYLKATGMQVGLLMNFGSKKGLEWKRIVFTDTRYQRKKNIPTNEELEGELKRQIESDSCEI